MHEAVGCWVWWVCGGCVVGVVGAVVRGAASGRRRKNLKGFKISEVR
jgi:hypothetical protein